MTSYIGRAYIAESAIERLAKQASIDVGKLGAHSLLLEAAIRTIMKHDLLDDWVSENSRPPSLSGRKMIAEDLGVVTQ